MRDLAVVLLGVLIIGGVASPDVHAESFEEIAARLSRETTEAYEASPFSLLSKDYFAGSRAIRTPRRARTKWPLTTHGKSSSPGMKIRWSH